MKVVDLFAGVGGFSEGFMQGGFDIVAAVEFDKQIAQSYKHNHKKTFVYDEDLKLLLKTQELDKYSPDLIVGGPPCQGFSMAGARIRKNFLDDPRNELFKAYFETVRRLKPKFFIFENVKGILTMENGEIFKEILKTFSDSKLLNGDKYFVHHKLLKASDFGIPQKRERVFIIGSLNKDFNFDELLEKTKEKITKKSPEFFKKTTVWDAISNLNSATSDGISSTKNPSTQFQKEMYSNREIQNHNLPKHSKIVQARIEKISEGENFTKLDEKINSVHSGSYGRLKKEDPSPTITTRFDTPSGGRFIHPIENRVLTPREGARIQSFPDSFNFTGSKSSIYKQIGNAVPPKLAYFFSEFIKLLDKAN